MGYHQPLEKIGSNEKPLVQIGCTEKTQISSVCFKCTHETNVFSNYCENMFDNIYNQQRLVRFCSLKNSLKNINSMLIIRKKRRSCFTRKYSKRLKPVTYFQIYRNKLKHYGKILGKKVFAEFLESRKRKISIEQTTQVDIDQRLNQDSIQISKFLSWTNLFPDNYKAKEIYSNTIFRPPCDANGHILPPISDNTQSGKLSELSLDIIKGMLGKKKNKLSLPNNALYLPSESDHNENKIEDVENIHKFFMANFVSDKVSPVIIIPDVALGVALYTIYDSQATICLLYTSPSPRDS